MSTFIERHGHIKYPVHGYLTSGPCEIPRCEEYRARLDAIGEQWTRDLNERFGTHYQNASKTPTYYLDHCHIHGWVRGVICGTCNVLMGWYDRDGKITVYDERPQYAVIAPGYLKYLDLRYESYAVKEAAFKEYVKNCPECAGLPAPKPGKKNHLMYQKPKECPQCHGEKIEPRPVCLFFNREIRPCDTENVKPPCSQCGNDKDEICQRCKGTGIAVLVKGKCDGCGLDKFIADEPGWFCRECYEDEMNIYDENEWSDALDGWGPWMRLDDLSH